MVAVGALAACGSSGGGTAASSTTAHSATTEHSATTVTTSDAGGSFGAYFPHALGTTWVYRLSGTVQDTVTQTVTAVDPQAGGGTAVTLSTHSAAHPGIDHTETYLLQADGRLAILPQKITFADGRQLPPGYSAVVYPSLDDLRSGRSGSGTLTQQLDPTSPDTISIPWTVQGGGTAKVTVPDGTFDTVVVRETIGSDDPIETTTYYAKGVGGVKVETEGSLTKLVTYTPGHG